MKISACYIVKDGAEDLARSLKSFAEFVDEITVAESFFGTWEVINHENFRLLYRA